MGERQPHLHRGPRAASRLAPTDPTVGKLEVAAHTGRLIASWDRPRYVPADEATHVRPDDYVVGVELDGAYRAYPQFIVDHYHMINDELAGQPLLFSSCERCQSGSAFLPIVDGRAAKFSAMSMYNAALTIVDRKRSFSEQGSVWLHYEGVAIEGPSKGTFLEQLPTYHTTWRDWREAHPETDVLCAPEDRHHRDVRRGHGSDEYFSRPGMEAVMARTITGAFDHRYPENEMVLGLNVEAGLRAYPLLEVQRSGGVVHDELDGYPIVVLAGPRPEQAAMAAFSSELDGQPLRFVNEAGVLRDEATGTRWSIEGRGLEGPMAGKRLTPLPWQYVRWHAWVYPHPSTELFESPASPPLYPSFPATPAVRALEPLLERFASLDAPLELVRTLPELGLPHEAAHGLSVRSGEHRMNLFRFASSEAAADYVALEGAWYCAPLDPKTGRKRSASLGPFVIESDPIDLYAEPTQSVRLPDNEASWAPVVRDADRLARWARDLGVTTDAVGPFAALRAFLERRGYDVISCAYLPHVQLRVGSCFAIAATIAADRFAVHWAEDEATAARIASEVGHAFHAGRWVLQSIPPHMYQDLDHEVGQLPDDAVRWSRLLGSEVFRNALDAFIREES